MKVLPLFRKSFFYGALLLFLAWGSPVNAGFLVPAFELQKTLSGDQNTLTVSTLASPNQSGHERIIPTCDGGSGIADYVKTPYVMDHGTLRVLGTSISSAITAGQITQTNAGVVGTPCIDDEGSPGKFSVSKALNVSSIATNGTYTAELTMCTTSGTTSCSTKSISFTITNRQTAQVPTVALSASPTSISSGGTATLSWTTTNSPTSCVGTGTGQNGWSSAALGTAPGGNTFQLSGMTETKTFTITCSNSAGQSQDAITVTVTGGGTSLSCSPSTQNVDINQTLTVTASGGTSGGSYSWSAPGAVTTSGIGSSFNTQYTTDGSKVITVNKNGASATCNVTVTEADPPPSNTQPKGFLDRSNNATCTVEGWAVDPDDRNQDLLVKIYSDSVFVTQVTANAIDPTRSGLTNECPQGSCSFAVDLTGLISTGVGHFISAVAMDASTGSANSFTLTGSPKTLTCSAGTGIGVDLKVRRAGVGNYQNTTLTVAPNSPLEFEWTTTGAPTSCTASQWWSGEKSATGGTEGLAGFSSGTRSYTITCSKGSATISDTVTVQTSSTAIGVGIEASPVNVTSGGSANLTWTTSGSPSACTASAQPSTTQWNNSTNPSPAGSSKSITNITQTSTYTIMCTKSGSSPASASVEVRVTAPNAPSVTLRVRDITPTVGTWEDSDLTVDKGDSIEIEWDVRNASSCTGSTSVATSAWDGPLSAVSSKPPRTRIVTNHQGIKEYSVSCTGAGGTTSESVTVRTPTPGSVTLTVRNVTDGDKDFVEAKPKAPFFVDSGDSVELKWVTQDVVSCSADSAPFDFGWRGTQNKNGGTQTLSNRTSKKTYTITCIDRNNEPQTSSATVDIRAQQGTIRVVSNEPTTWTITAGPGSPEQSEQERVTNKTYSNQTAGSYTIEAEFLDGLGAPKVEISASQNLSAGGEITFALTYTGGGGGGGGIQCSPLQQTVDIEGTANFESSGGTGDLLWNAPDGDPSTGANNNVFSTRYDTLGNKTVTVSGSTGSASCTVTVTEPQSNAQCSDGIDNDGDDLIDFADGAGDPGCSGPNDNNESDEQEENYSVRSSNNIVIGTASGSRSSATRISISPQGGFTESVRLSSDNIQHMTETFDDGVGAPNGRDDTTLLSSEYAGGVEFYVVSTKNLTAGDSYTITISGNVRGIRRDVDVTLRVANIGSGSGTTTPIFEEF